MESFHSGWWWDYIPLGVLHIFLKPHIDPLSYKRRSRKEVAERGVVVMVVLVLVVLVMGVVVVVLVMEVLVV